VKKEDRIDFDPVSGRMRRGPRQVFLEISSRCNLTCVHCSKDFGSEHGHPQLDLPLESVERIAPWLEEADDINLNMVGESLVSPHFDEILKRCARGNARLHFNTNGLLMDERRCQLVVDLGVSSIGFSIDGLESNRPIRGIPFEAVKQRMLTLDRVRREHGGGALSVGISYVLMKRNLHELPGVLADLMSSVRIDFVHVQPLVVFYETLRGENVYEARGVDALIARCREISQRHGAYLSLFRSEFVEDERHRSDEAPQIGAKSARFGCTDPFFEIKIRSTGEVMSCSYGLVPGFNVHAMELDEIWNHAWYRDLRRRLFRQVFEGRCAGCPFIFGSAHNQMAVHPGVHHSEADRFYAGYGEDPRPAPPPEDGLRSARPLAQIAERAKLLRKIGRWLGTLGEAP
jgi:MoaA/NifB/PqqE/SkfB family radical SAM enzyme